MCAIDQSTRPESIKSSDQFIKSLLHVTEHIINQHDTINRLENALDKFSEQSSIDDVTGLPNQDSFFHAADAHKEKYGPLNAPIAVLIIDIGGVILKSKTSDLNYKDLMRALSVAMSKLLRETDSLYKLDGSRFAMLLINVDTKFVSAMVMKISKHLEPFNLKVSIGADVCREGQSMSKSIEQANNNKLI